MLKEYQVIYDKPRVMWLSSIHIDNTLDSVGYSPELIRNKKIVLNSGFDIFKLRDIINSNLVTGNTPEYSEKYNENSAVLLKTVNIDYNVLDDSKLFYIKDVIHESQLKRSKLNEGDIIITVIGATDDVIGRAVIYNNYPNKANITQSLCKFSIKSNYDKYFVSTFINCKYGHSLILQKAASSTRRYINNTDLGEILIPIPSYEIQKHIGDKVRKAEELREEAKRFKKEAEEILYHELKKEEFLEKQKAIVNKFIWINNKDIDTRIDSEYYKPNYILYRHLLKKNGIMTLKIKDIVKEIKTGTTPESKFIKQEEQNIKFLRVNNLDYCFLNEDDLLYIDNNYEEKKLRFLQQEDILVSIAGTLGRSSVVDTNKCTTNQNIAALTLRNINDIRPYYLSLYFNSYFGKLSLDTISTQATVKYVNNELLGEIEIPIIKIDTQILIENKVIEYKNKLNNSKQLIREAKQDVEDLIEGNFDISKIKETN